MTHIHINFIAQHFSNVQINYRAWKKSQIYDKLHFLGCTFSMWGNEILSTKQCSVQIENHLQMEKFGYLFGLFGLFGKYQHIL